MVMPLQFGLFPLAHRKAPVGLPAQKLYIIESTTYGSCIPKKVNILSKLTEKDSA